jgi:hypothetical protein
MKQEKNTDPERRLNQATNPEHSPAMHVEGCLANNSFTW